MQIGSPKASVDMKLQCVCLIAKGLTGKKRIEIGPNGEELPVESILQKLKNVPEGHFRLYHGTTELAAAAILNSLPSLSHAPSDFGAAFYLTNSIRYALNWASFKATENRAAVIIFDIPNDHLARTTPILNMTNDSLLWSGTVIAHRNDNSSAPNYDFERDVSAQVLIGQIKGNAREIERGRAPYFLRYGNFTPLQWAFRQPAAMNLTRSARLSVVVLEARRTNNLLE